MTLVWGHTNAPCDSLLVAVSPPVSRGEHNPARCGEAPSAPDQEAPMTSLRAGCDVSFPSGISVKNNAMITFQKAWLWHLRTGCGGGRPVRPATTWVPGPVPDALSPEPAPDSWRRQSASAPTGPLLCPSRVDQCALSGLSVDESLGGRTREGGGLGHCQLSRETEEGLSGT